MKNQSNFGSVFLVLLACFLTLGIQSTYAQDAKNKVRINAQYMKIMDGDSYFEIKATSRINKKNVAVSGIDILVYNELEDDNIEIGKTTTNHMGKAKFVLESLSSIQADSANTYNIGFKFKGNEQFKKASKGISFKDVNIIAKIILEDSINYMKARLVEPSKDSAIADIPLRIQVQRLFRPLIIGEEFNSTDVDGTIFVPIEEEISGVDGKLIFEVVLDESDDYGTVTALVHSAIGTPIVDESTFDKRTMWSPRNKTPLFLLIFPNILIFGTWGLILYLIINLFKISKAKS